MNTDPRLIERSAKNKAESNSDVKNSSTEMVVKFDINYNKSQVEFKNLNEKWQKLCNLNDLTEIDNIDEYFEKYGLTFSDKVLNELEILKSKIKESFDQDINMFELSYRVNSDKSSEFYIPLETEYTDDLTIKKIYNSSGEFVANDLEDNISYPIHKIESKSFYIENISEQSEIQVFSKNKQTFREFMDERYDDYSGDIQDVKYASYFTTFMYGSSGMFYALGYTDIAFFLLFIYTCLFFFSIIMPLCVIIQFIEHLYWFAIYNRSNKQVAKSVFVTD